MYKIDGVKTTYQLGGGRHHLFYRAYYGYLIVSPDSMTFLSNVAVLKIRTFLPIFI